MHDQGWAEREIFGKIRCDSSAPSCLTQCGIAENLMHALAISNLTGVSVPYCRYMNYNGECCSCWLCLLIRLLLECDWSRVGCR